MNRVRSIEEHYSISEAARRLGVHRNTVRNWIEAKHIVPIFRLSRTTVRIPASAIQRHLNSGREGRIVDICPPSFQAA